MIRCTRCLMPDTRPRIVFTDGVCNACLYHEAKKEIDWNARKTEFLEVVERHRGTGPYDCVVPFSGGKDSATIAWRLKFEFGLNPLLVCYGQLLWTDVGRRNLDRVAQSGFDIIYWRVSQHVSRSCRGAPAGDGIRDRYGAPDSEPRHPDLASGKPWPIISLDTNSEDNTTASRSSSRT